MSITQVCQPATGGDMVLLAHVGLLLKPVFPGLRYRGSSKNALPVMLIFGIAVIGVLIVYNVVRLIVFLVSKAYYAIKRL